jgi:RNA polymerase sigma factor (TIGR02999 family)
VIEIKDLNSVALGMSNVTQILERVRAGNDPKAQEELLNEVYNELRIIAKAKMANERPGHTLQATILANDAWLKLFPDGKSAIFENRGHFFGTAAIVMHRILVDHARRRLAIKRGGDLHKTQLSDTQFVELAHPASDEVIEAVHEALEKFAKIDKSTVVLVELRFFVGLSMQEAADVLGITKISAERDYAYFSAWFRREYGRDMNS